MNKVKYLVISSTLDFSTDLICIELEKRNVSYLRINRDKFLEYKIIYELDKQCMTIIIDEKTYVAHDMELESVYFRAPVFLRNMSKLYTVEEQLQRSQWSSFIRNLSVFKNAKWINHPFSVYSAENKLYQLSIAKDVGLDVPTTYVGNDLFNNIDPNLKYIVKSLDTALFYENGKEMFVYTSIFDGSELLNANIKNAPIIVQNYLPNKIDVRVTVIGNKIYPVTITNNGKSIYEDWRKLTKEQLCYTLIKLPDEIEIKIKKLMDKLNLTFGGIDLIISNGKYYFIEVNPTGEWGWLTNVKSLPINESIVDEMLGVNI